MCAYAETVGVALDCLNKLSVSLSVGVGGPIMKVENLRPRRQMCSGNGCWNFVWQPSLHSCSGSQGGQVPLTFCTRPWWLFFITSHTSLLRMCFFDTMPACCNHVINTLYSPAACGHSGWWWVWPKLHCCLFWPQPLCICCLAVIVWAIVLSGWRIPSRVCRIFVWIHLSLSCRWVAMCLVLWKAMVALMMLVWVWLTAGSFVFDSCGLWGFL